MKASLPANEMARLAALREYEILDTLPEQAFDDLALLAAQLCGTPVAMVSLVDEARQWFKSRKGISAKETGREVSFCAHAILEPDQVMVVPDTRDDPRFANNPSVIGEPYFRFYAGAPLITSTGLALGTLCVLDFRPQAPRSEALTALKALGRLVVAQLESRRQARHLERAEAELQSQLAELEIGNARWRFALESTGDGVWDWDVAAGTVFFSRRYKEIFGFAETEIGSAYEEWASRVHPDDLPQVMSELQSHFDGVTPEYHNEHRGRCKNGSYKWILARGMVVKRDTDGKPRRMVGTHSDITKRKAAENLLRLNTQLLEESQSIAKLGGWEFDLETKQLFWTAETYRLHDTSPEEFNPTVDAGVSYFLPESRRIISEALQAAMERGIPYDLDLETHTTKGRLIKVRTTCVVTQREGRPVKLTGIFQDITAQKNTEADRERLAAQLLHSQKLEAIGTLAGGIAHDFNNILVGIYGYADLARAEAAGNKPVLECLDGIRQAGRRAAELVQQILAFSRVDKLSYAPVGLTQIADEAVKLLRSSIPTAILFDVTLPANLPPVQGNATQLHQVIMNLGTNAAHAMRDKPGRLTVCLDLVDIGADDISRLPAIKSGRHLRLTVNDTGQGMDAAVQARIFEPFFTTKGQGEGTGLGLSVVHGIVEAHHGVIRVTSTPGIGTTFEIYLPVIERPLHKSAEMTASLPRGHGQRILIVDDEETICFVNRELLSALGYVAESENLPRQALERFERDRRAYDLVLTDLTMPEMSGLELAERIHALQPNVPLILASGNSTLVAPERIAAAGVREILPKPYTQEALAEIIGKYIA